MSEQQLYTMQLTELHSDYILMTDRGSYTRQDDDDTDRVEVEIANKITTELIERYGLDKLDGFNIYVQLWDTQDDLEAFSPFDYDGGDDEMPHNFYFQWTVCTTYQVRDLQPAQRGIDRRVVINVTV